jgi:biotin carboxylase
MFDGVSVLGPSAHYHGSAEGLQVCDATGTALETLFHGIPDLKSRTEVAVKVILVLYNGYMCSSDILELRMRHCEAVDTVVSFATWEHYLPACSVHEEINLLELLQSSPGAIVAKKIHSSDDEALDLLQIDLELRLSFDWILPTKPAARCVAVVAGRPMYEPKRCIYWSQGYFMAARALGISMIVFDEPGHWLEGEEYAHLRDEFIAIDMSDKKNLPGRLVEALNGRHIDGIVTFTDDYTVITAEAAELLGLPTESARAMWQAHNKNDMRRLVDNGSVQTIHLESLDQLESPELAESFATITYPLIVKPCRGAYSRGVKRVDNDISMRRAVHELDEDNLTGHGILLETYVDGPEVDANFVLWDDQILFLEVNDNFPCKGDASGATTFDNFAETVSISNSGLSPKEIETIRSSLHRNLLQLGFHSGVFHVEARMRNSSFEYQDIYSDGIVDLAPHKSDKCAKGPSVFIIEVNVRTPGAGGTWATRYTYGVDLGALQLLRSIGDRERFKRLSKPFSFASTSPGGGGGAQCWTAHSMIPIHREKILVPEDFFERLYRTLPDIKPHVFRAELYAQPGAIVSPSGGVGWIGYLLLFSRRSRRHVLEMYHRVAEAAKMCLDE